MRSKPFSEQWWFDKASYYFERCIWFGDNKMDEYFYCLMRAEKNRVKKELGENMEKDKKFWCVRKASGKTKCKEQCELCKQQQDHAENHGKR